MENKITGTWTVLRDTGDSQIQSKVKVNFDSLERTVNFFETKCDALETDLYKSKDYIEQLESEFGADTYKRIGENMENLTEIIHGVCSQVRDLKKHIAETLEYYTQCYNKFGPQRPHSEDCLVRNEKTYGGDGHSISGTNSKLKVDDTIYYNGFGSETGYPWISDAAAKDKELAQLLSNYNSAYEGLHSHGDGYVAYGASRQKYIDDLKRAEDALQKHLHGNEENGVPTTTVYPTLTTHSGS